MSRILKPVLGSQIQIGHPLAQGLIGCWLFNEGAGQKVFDLSGNNHIGDLIADAHFAPGMFGSVLSLDGTDDYGDMGDFFNFSTGDFSVSVWMKSNLADVSKNQVIVGKLSTDTWDGWSLHIHSTNDYMEFWTVDANSNTKATGIVSITDSNWHHVVGVRNGDTVSLYVDRILEKSTVGTIRDVDINENLKVGSYGGTSAFFEKFNGLIDVTMIFNRSLSAIEVAQLYHEPFTMFEKPKLWWIVGGVEYEETIDVTLEIESGLIHTLKIPLSSLIETEASVSTTIKSALSSLVEVEAYAVYTKGIKASASALIEMESSASATLKTLISSLVEVEAQLLAKLGLSAVNTIEMELGVSPKFKIPAIPLIEMGADVNVLMKTLISSLVEMEAAGVYKTALYVELLSLISIITKLINDNSGINKTVSDNSLITKLIDEDSPI